MRDAHGGGTPDWEYYESRECYFFVQLAREPCAVKFPEHMAACPVGWRGALRRADTVSKADWEYWEY